MKNTLRIPDKCRVGFQTRRDTYTGKLAFVTWVDEKGETKQKASWNGWRDKSIGVLDLENVPTSGFVLNKKVGEVRSSWNPRLAWVRVWDPRNFEFEISVANLLFILQEGDCLKGKGLSGEFVFAWDKQKVILLPTSSQEYEESKKYSSLVKMKVKTSELTQGAKYLTQDSKELTYLGKEHIYAPRDTHTSDGKYTIGITTWVSRGPHHIFTNDKGTIVTLKKLDKLSKKVSDPSDHSWQTLLANFKLSIPATKPTHIIESKIHPKNISYRALAKQKTTSHMYMCRHYRGEFLPTETWSFDGPKLIRTGLYYGRLSFKRHEIDLIELHWKNESGQTAPVLNF